MPCRPWKRKSELSFAFFLVQEMINHWPQIFAYISSTSQRQEFQHLEGRLRIFLRVSACK